MWLLLGNFWKNWCYFSFQHLVTLSHTDVERRHISRAQFKLFPAKYAECIFYREKLLQKRREWGDDLQKCSQRLPSFLPPSFNATFYNIFENFNLSWTEEKHITHYCSNYYSNEPRDGDNKRDQIKGRSLGLVVMGRDSGSKGHGFESQHCILDEHFSHIFVEKIVLFVWKDWKKLEARVGPFFL